MKEREAETERGRQERARLQQVVCMCVSLVSLGHAIRQTRGVLCDKYSFMINELSPLSIN